MSYKQYTSTMANNFDSNRFLEYCKTNGLETNDVPHGNDVSRVNDDGDPRGNDVPAWKSYFDINELDKDRESKVIWFMLRRVLAVGCEPTSPCQPQNGNTLEEPYDNNVTYDEFH